MFRILVLLSLLIILTNQMIVDRNCMFDAAIEIVETDFDLEKYQGLWYEIYRFESQTKLFGCSTMLYVLSDDNENDYTVYNSYTNLRTKEKMQIEGTAKLDIPNDPTKLAILDIQYPKKATENVSTWVFDTDYENYALVWACKDFATNRSRENVWLMSRTPQLPEKVLDHIDVLLGVYFNLDVTGKTVQDDRCD